VFRDCGELRTNQSTYRDEALRQTRRLQADIQAERDTLKTLMGYE